MLEAQKITRKVKRRLDSGDILSTLQGEDMDNLENINAVQRIQLYIDLHLKGTITLHQLAQAAGYSPWHAAKIFKELTG
jgi:AraC-like DNA-binding protein